MNCTIPISADYRRPIRDALGLQIVLGLISLGVLDGGDFARICGIAVVAFWLGVAVLIARRAEHPAPHDLRIIRFGFLPVFILTFLAAHAAWSIRGLV